MIVGSGIDVIEIARIERVLARHGERFLGRLLAPSEREACAVLRRPAPRIALCFAAKEAVMKAVGTGWAHGVRWVDIETLWPTRPATGLPPRPATGAPPRPEAGLPLRASTPDAAGVLPCAQQQTAVGGEPRETAVLLRGRVAEIAHERGAARCWLALSRSRQHAMAVALLEGDGS